MYLSIVFNHPINKSFTYIKPASITRSLVGHRVIAPFRSQKLKGMVTGEFSAPNEYAALAKPIDSVLDDEPVFNARMLDLAHFMSEYYFCSLGEALFASVPAGDKGKRPRKKTLSAQTPLPFLTLNDEQQKAFAVIDDAIKKNEKRAFLLHGVTGSGKTEVYLRAIRSALDQGKQAIALIPEISLTPQTIRRFKERFSEDIAVLHSKLSKTEKYDYWQRIRKGEIRLVIGARTAVFSPANNLGVIVIDEEHEGSYKSSDTPRFHARQIAFYRMAKENAVLIAGSATPSLESYYYATETKTMQLLALSKRVMEGAMPSVTIIDMKTAKRTEAFPELSEELTLAIRTALEEQSQAMLFLNRKGYSPIISCMRCGETLLCPNCNVTLTYHKRKDALICHYCGYAERIPPQCPSCNEASLRMTGAGTEKIEEHLALLFPSARIVRMDHDTTRAEGAYEEILGAFANGETDILLGTQMIAKGLHFPNVTLVGVLNADQTLTFPDFRREEKTFNMLAQVAGRSGRGEKAGAVYIQTRDPENFAILAAKEHDYETFYRQELIRREPPAMPAYPPFTRLVRLVLRGPDERLVEEDCMHIAHIASAYLAKMPDKTRVAGPAPCALDKLKTYYRWNILFKTQNPKYLKPFIDYINAEFKFKRGNYLEIDVDPYNML